jgi:hypothetical protein
MSPLADLTLVAWALVEVGVRVREGVQGKGRPDRDRATRVLIVIAPAQMVLGSDPHGHWALGSGRANCASYDQLMT